ncbi:UvrD-helicase domain-containing protein [Myxococcus stipitatus]|uniref:UvrD-helicase domain-containing protein n=1 Tax=Myxococcus stipitatus TaxID=83455 RepID=UPI00191C0EF5|nr:UvrD-helicase domain-containing protein [Myxococcus stipitatus]
MSTVKVVVRKSGQVIETVARPLREAEGGPAVVYRRRFWRYAAGSIDLDSRPLAPDEGNGRPAGSAQEERSEPRAVPATDDAGDREAIRTASAGVRMLVEAGPGTGKTEMAAQRIAGLIRAGLSPGQLLVLSFSRSAVRTLTRRLSRVAGPEDRVLEELRHVSIRTFDSWVFRMLRLLGGTPSALLAREHDANIAELTALIAGSRRDDVRALAGDRRHLIVDEFQDLPGVRGELVLALLELLAPPGHPGCGFTILGDPAQAIYGFAARNTAGAVFPGPAEYWKRVLSAYGAGLDVRTLRRNYRANAPLAGLSAKLRGVLLGPRPDEEKLRVIRESIAALPAPTQPIGPDWMLNGDAGNRAVLTRTNGEALRVMQKLFGSEVEGPMIPVRLRAGGHALLPPAWIATLLRRLRSPEPTRSQFTKIYAHVTGQGDMATHLKSLLPPEDVAWARLARASGAAEDTSSISVSDLRARLNWPDAFPDDQPSGEEGVIISTIHQSKGMEFDIVTILDARDDDGAPGEDSEAPAKTSAGEEASVGYVAITRAGGVLERMDGDAIHPPPRSRKFQGERQRLCHWRAGWVNLEMGLRGDLDPFGFVNPVLHDGAAGVESLQEFLLENARRLEGHKVMLCKQMAHGKALWNVHLQRGSSPDRLIGRTAHQLTYDLMRLLSEKGYSLPKTIMNLRIAGVGTVTSEAEFELEEPDRSSRLWLGVSLFGMGDFKPLRKKS